MANNIRIKRRAAGGAAGAPSSLANAELAFNEQDDTLYYGKGTGGAEGTATQVIAIGGPGAFLPLTATAAAAQKLITARTINGVSFDGSANITINAVDSTARIASSEKGAANGVATLGADGKVPATQLPSYVDDVLEYANLAGFPVTGSTSTIYVALDTNKIYRWSGSAYIEISVGGGTADAAIKLSTARTIGMTGDVTWTSAAFDGSGNVTGAATLANSGVTAGTFKSVTVDAKGRVTAGTNPTTLAGYGITDAAASNHNHSLASLSDTTITSNTAGEVLKWDGSKWINNTLAEAGIQPAIAAGTTAQVWRGDKTWVTLDLTYLPDAAFKKSVRAATTANLTATFASGVLTNSGTLAALALDGVTLAVNDRVLVKDQTATAQNGIYAVTNAGSASVAWVLTRVADADTSVEIAGSTVNVDSGTANGGLRFDTDFKTSDTINTTGITWNRVMDTGMASTVAGAALGTAAVGTSLNYARADHVHAAPTTVSGNAGTATKLATARTIALSGAVTGSVSFDGSANVTIATTFDGQTIDGGTF